MSTQEYYDNIDQCADGKINRIISNGLAEHAVYLLTKMFLHAESRVRIYSGELADEANGTPVYGSQKLISAAKKFLREDGSTLEILVQKNVADIEEKAFVRAIQEQKDAGELKGILRIRKANASVEKIDNHFMVMDESGYRLELDHEHTKAIANFGDSEFASRLVRVFDHGLFDRGSDLITI